MARACGSAYAAALASVQEGTVRMSLGDWERGLAVLRTVAHLDLRLPLEQLAVLLNRGLAEVTLLDLDRGRRDLRDALEISAREGLAELVFKARHNLGYLEYAAGDLPAAIRLMREADDMDVDVDRVQARHDLGRVLLEAGLVRQALDLLGAAAASARLRAQRLDEGVIGLDLARAHLLVGDLAAASAAATAAARAFATRGDAVRAGQARLVRRAVDLGRGVRVRADPGPAVSLDDPAGRMSQRLLVEAHLLRGRTAQARAGLVALRALPPRQRDGLGAQMHEGFLRAWLADLDGDDDGAARAIRTARARLERRRGLSPGLEVRAGLSVHGQRLADLDLGRALRSGRPRAVVDTVARWRGASQRVLPVHPDDDPATAALVAELRLLRRTAAAEEDPARAAASGAEIDRVERRLEERTWARRGATSGAAERVSSGALRARLTERGESMLVLVAWRGRYHAVVLGRRRSALRTLPDVDVAALALRLRRDLRARAFARGTPLDGMLERAVTASAGALDRALLAPVADLLADGVVVAPTRDLMSVPWSMLPSVAGRPVTVAPSLSRWARPPERTGGGVAALAGPGLPRARAEAEEVARAWAGAGAGAGAGSGGPRAATRVRLAPEATCADVVAGFAAGGVVHVAAHGRHEEQSPLFSSLWMTDGPLFAHELTTVRPGLAVLSACDVGQSQVRPGDEPLGLTAALLALGVSAVVAAVAPIADDVAAQAMQRYHRLLAAGRGAADALREVRSVVPGADLLSLYGADWRRDPAP